MKALAKHRRRQVENASTIAAALPDGAWWAIIHAAGRGGWSSAIERADLESGIAWSVVEMTPKGRRFHLTDLGQRIHADAVTRNRGVAPTAPPTRKEDTP